MTTKSRRGRPKKSKRAPAKGTNHTCVIDFPWPVREVGGRYTKDGRKRPGCWQMDDMPYKLMTKKQILDFAIDDFAAPDSLLFMWTTHSQLPFACKVMEHWGFTYYCCMTWVKDNGITLHGITRNSEFVLFGYRGSYMFKAVGEAVKAAFSARRRDNSVKPAEFYEMIRPKTPEPRIDIFARRRHKGFSAWGDQVENGMQEVLV